MRRRVAFTILELLVVIAVLGLLVGLLMPAIQSSRESARRITCLTNLRQIGLALHHYHDVHKSFPVGCLEWRGMTSPPGYRQLAWSAFLLEFLEQRALAARIDFARPFDDPANAVAAATRVAVYECPTAFARSLARARTDYGGLYGELITDPITDDGVFLHERTIRFRHIRDGLKQTLAVAEDVSGPDSEWINGRNVFVQSGGINDPSAWIGDNEIRSKHPQGACGLFADARAEWLSAALEKQTLGKCITRAKGDIVDLTQLEP